jgi:pyridoxamine 5'-phosphate oxidase
VEGELRDAWLGRDPLPEDPIPIVVTWLDEAFADELQANPHAVTLATIDPDGRPSARMVLCNAIDATRGAFVTYTNRNSRKGRAIAANPRAAMVFYWAPFSRSVRVEGIVELTSDADSDAYFATRPVDAQVGAWASAQSEPIASRSELVTRVQDRAREFGVSLEEKRAGAIPRPPHWGGFTLVADAVELWVSRAARIHDRACWRRSVGPGPDTAEPGPWRVERLQP